MPSDKPAGNDNDPLTNFCRYCVKQIPKAWSKVLNLMSSYRSSHHIEQSIEKLNAKTGIEEAKSAKLRAVLEAKTRLATAKAANRKLQSDIESVGKTETTKTQSSSGSQFSL